MTSALERSIDRLRARALLGAFAGTALTWLAIGAAALGALALVARVALRWEAREAAWVLAPLALVPVLAWIHAQRRLPSRAGTVAWLDVRAGGTGSLVAAHEADDPRWRAQVDAALAREPALPGIRVAQPARIALLCTVFALAVLFVPISHGTVGPPLAVQEATLERVEEQLAALQEQVELDPELAEEMRESLNRLQQEGALEEPESAFEALDRAQDRLEEEALERAEAAQAGRDELARAADEAASNPEAAQEQLERTLGQLAQAGLARDVRAALEKELGIAGLTLPAGTKLDAAEIQALSKALGEQLAARLGQLGKGGLLDAKALAKLGELAKLDGFEFEEHVCDETCELKPGGT